MINFNSRITKSIIIAIFILSLTISIYVVPASAIVTGSLSSADISPIFSLDNYNYFYIRSSIYGDANGTDFIRYQNFFPNSSEFFNFYLHPYLESNNTGTTTANSSLLFFGRLPPYTQNSQWSYYYNGTPLGNSSNEYRFDDYLRFQLPLGIQGSTKITIQFVMLTNTSQLADFIFENITKNALSKRLVKVFAVDGSGVGHNLQSSVYEYDGIAQYSGTPPEESHTGNIASYWGKVFDIEITNMDFVDYLYIDVNFLKNLSVPGVNYDALNNLYFGVTKIYYEGANTQLTDIQDSINGLISGIENQGTILDEMTKQQAEFYENMLQLSPAGQQIIQDVQNNFSEGEQGLDDLIQGITVDKPEPDELLPDHEVVLGRYMDRGGSEALGAVITPLFDETGPIYIMLFAVLSIALISYVLYGKKA